MRLVDSHCHLPLIADESRSVEDIVESANARDVTHMLCVNVQMETFPDVLAAARVSDRVYATVGVHPNTDGDVHEPDVDELAIASEDQKVVAIGETGLDYFRSSGDLGWQRERFRTHIRAARETGYPLVVHTRDAAADTLEIMRAEKAADVGGVMHCFVEDWETASAAMDLGFYISFSGIVTFKNATDLQAVAKRVPLERMLIETDAPWLAPVPKRGKTNEPAFVRYTAEFLSTLCEVDFETFARATSANFFHLFLPDRAGEALA